MISPAAERKWLAAGLAGLILRVTLWWFSIGSNDTVMWSYHARHVLEYGLTNSYSMFPEFNHPPLMGLYAALAWSRASGNLMQFARLMKLPGMGGELLTMWALWRFCGYRAFAAYALLPCAILVSGFHGNTDCLYAALILVAAIAFDRERYFLSGVLWSAALNVKLLPLVLIPLILLGAPNLKAFTRLMSGFFIGILPFLPAALTVGRAMYRNMIAYNSLPDNWGVIALLNMAGTSPELSVLSNPVRSLWLLAGRYIILFAVISVAVLSRFRKRMPMVEQGALGSALFLVLTPGFGVQYVMFAAPLLCMTDLPEGVRWGYTSGVFIGSVYLTFLVSWMPLQSVFTRHFPLLPMMLGLLAWGGLIHYLSAHIRAASRLPDDARPA